MSISNYIGWCVVIGSVSAIAVIVIAGLAYPYELFDWNKNSISSLGAIAHGTKDNLQLSPYPWILDNGLIGSGAILLLFSLGLLYHFINATSGNIRLEHVIGSTLFAVVAIGAIAVGSYPLPSAYHPYAAAIAFIPMFFALCLFIKLSSNMFLQGSTIILAIITLVGLVIVGFESNNPNGHVLAGPELMIIVPGMIWVFCFSLSLIKDKVDQSRS